MGVIMRTNSKMEKMLNQFRMQNFVLTPDLSLIVSKGFSLIDGFLILNDFWAGGSPLDKDDKGFRYNLKYSTDMSGYEFTQNKHHIEGRGAFVRARAYADALLARFEEQFPEHMRLCVIFAAHNPKTTIVSCHLIREGEVVSGGDLELFKLEGVMVLETDLS